MGEIGDEEFEETLDLLKKLEKTSEDLIETLYPKAAKLERLKNSSDVKRRFAADVIKYHDGELSIKTLAKKYPEIVECKQDIIEMVAYLVGQEESKRIEYKKLLKRKVLMKELPDLIEEYAPLFDDKTFEKLSKIYKRGKE